eukprot:TRINITY_DN7229_c0_g1_i1.p1 TRINITY_DN7229_c0_g1~~TRINITY_DN7229_c0_g1_i1.p1  ORF type:complete len:403 (-),score=94.31 TRINITY_DN7229_c0_g1_i1:56-1123(-)
MRKEAFNKQLLNLEPYEGGLEMFSHLPQFKVPVSYTGAMRADRSVHPAVVRLGIKYAKKKILGSNARGIAMLTAFKIVFKEFETTEEIAIAFDKEIETVVQFLEDCRPISFGMDNIKSSLKSEIANIRSMDLEGAKEYLINYIDSTIQKIEQADALITQYGAEKIYDGDVILTYACSYVVEQIIVGANADGKKFRVVIVDSGPKYEGKTLLKKLLPLGIECSYVFIGAISYILPEVTKVLIGANTVASNGAVVSRSGSAIVAMMAHARHTPVMVACETYKFHERVHLDSICYNEVEEPNTSQDNDKPIPSNKNLKCLSLAYDVIPGDYVSVVVTEVGLIPPTSVPVFVLRDLENN